MKKFLALLLAAMMCLCAIPAMAETAEIPAVENGAWVPFTDYNMQICLPSDWQVLELTEEQSAAGIIFSCKAPDSDRAFQLSYNELEAAIDVDGVLAQLSTVYPSATKLSLNNLDFVTYVIEEQKVAGLALLGGSGIGLYTFNFYPSDDADFMNTLAVQIAGSISAIE